MKDCSANLQDYKCINRMSFNKHNQGKTACASHSSLDKNCPSFLAVLEKQKETTQIINYMFAYYNSNVNSNINTEINISQRTKIHNTLIKFLQINLQHSRAATNNLMKTTEEEGIDIICIQEPYVINNKVIGIPKNIKSWCMGPEGTEPP